MKTFFQNLFSKLFSILFFKKIFFNTFFKKIFIKTFLSTLTTLWRSIDVFLWWTFFDSFDDPLTSPHDEPPLTSWRSIDISTWWTFFDSFGDPLMFSHDGPFLTPLTTHWRLHMMDLLWLLCLLSHTHWVCLFPLDLLDSDLLISYLTEGWLCWPLRLYFILLRLASATFLCYWLTEATFLHFFITRFPCVLGLGLCLLSHAHWFCWILFRLDLTSWTWTFLTPYLVGGWLFSFVILVTWTIWRSTFMKLHVPKRVVEDRPSEHPSHDLLLV